MCVVKINHCSAKLKKQERCSRNQYFQDDNKTYRIDIITALGERKQRRGRYMYFDKSYFVFAMSLRANGLLTDFPSNIFLLSIVRGVGCT